MPDLSPSLVHNDSVTDFQLQRPSSNNEEQRQGVSSPNRDGNRLPPAPRVTSRKRQRPSFFFELSLPRSPSGLNNADLAKESLVDAHPDRPDWDSVWHLLGGLFLTSGLGVLSAMDAKTQCLDHETNAVMELVDDDVYQDYEEAADVVVLEHHICTVLFRDVVLPAGIGTAVLSVFGMMMIYCQSRRWKWTYVADDDFPRIFRNLVFLLFMLMIMVGLQTYNVAWIMLNPRNLYEDNNPYQSLAAVDRYGHVGDNANLYYLTWISEGLALSLLYQVSTSTFRAYRRARRQLRGGTAYQQGKDVTALLRATSWRANYSDYPQTLVAWWRERRRRYKTAWYNSLYKLRFRTGIWTAAFLSSWVIVASSQYVASQVLWPSVPEEYGQFAWSDFSSRLRVCKYIGREKNNSLPPQYCGRTMAAWLAGIASMVLCATAIMMHVTARYCGGTNNSSLMGQHDDDDEYDEDEDDHGQGLGSGIWSTGSIYDKTALTAWERVISNHYQSRRLPLNTELILSIILSILNGFNAVFVTGVQGPAATVGNLYYASWGAYLLCMRIALGCLEEYYDLSEDAEGNTSLAGRGGKLQAINNGENQIYQAPTLVKVDDTYAIQNAGTNGNNDQNDMDASKVSNGVRSSSFATADSNISLAKDMKMERARLEHVRSYFFLGIFSLACAASAYDAASNSDQTLSRIQKYMILAPCFVSAQSVLLFIFSLSRQCYSFISMFWIGGLFSVCAFGALLGNLVLTMHSDDSWAVNGIGEIEMANLYYFSWASILTAGVQMTSFVKAFLGMEMKDLMSVVWVAIVKVCFVILGAAMHIWNTIQGNCGFEDITTGAFSFCSRTILAIVVSLTGMLIGGLVVLGRLCMASCPSCGCSQIQSHVEMVLSFFFVLLFGAAVAMITGIGGPGQSVGDLYYSTWLAFWVSLGVFLSCYSELSTKERLETGSPELTRKAPSVLV